MELLNLLLAILMPCVFLGLCICIFFLIIGKKRTGSGSAGAFRWGPMFWLDWLLLIPVLFIKFCARKIRNISFTVAFWVCSAAAAIFVIFDMTLSEFGLFIHDIYDFVKSLIEKIMG